MSGPPELLTARLRLRAFTLNDAPAVEALVGAREIAANTLTIPHPYPPGGAAEWISKRDGEFREGSNISFAVTLRDENTFIGTMGLKINRSDDSGEVGYWIGVPYWGKGYASEALGAVIRYGFESCALNRIYAAHFSRNPGSGRVMQKNGMTWEGTLRQVHRKWDEYVDVEMYAILRSEWLERN